MLAEFQTDLLRRITDPAADDGPGLKIHRDTWFHGLLDGLVEVYEAAHRLLGDEAFKAFARDFIRARLLTAGDRNGYGGDFADFVQVHPALGALRWLPDLLRYEWALHVAHHARDVEPARFEALLMPDARIALHPSVSLLALNYDVKALHDGTTTTPRLQPCDLLIGRDLDDAVVRLCLAPYEADFLALVARHESLVTALDRLKPGQDDLSLLQNLLAGLVARGLLIILRKEPS